MSCRPLKQDRVGRSRQTGVLPERNVDLRMPADERPHDVAVQTLVGEKSDHDRTGRCARSRSRNAMEAGWLRIRPTASRSAASTPRMYLSTSERWLR